MTAQPITSMPVKVRFHECDPQGVVFNAHYLAFADMASFECLNTLFGSYHALHAFGVDLVVAEATVRFRAACRFEDELRVDCYVDRVGTTSLGLRFDVRRGDEQAAEVLNRYVWVDTEQLRPRRPPPEVREAFERFLVAG
ncbi:MAG: acyl-CoA thioesterase [Thermocrispum sp.]